MIRAAPPSQAPRSSFPCPFYQPPLHSFRGYSNQKSVVPSSTHARLLPESTLSSTLRPRSESTQIFVLVRSPCRQACRSAPHGAPMASPACHKPPVVHGIPCARKRPQHFSNLFPVAAPAPQQPDPLPYPRSSHNFLIFPHLASASAPFLRKVFEDSACDALPGATASTPVACSPPIAEDHGHGRADNFAISSLSSSSDSLSFSSDNEEDDTGSSSTSSLQSAFDSQPDEEGPLDDLASLCSALPIKRGLSRYFSGKSQSFSSLARVTSLAELAKPENRYVKRRRTARPCADSIRKHHSYPPPCPPTGAGISKTLASCNRHQGFTSIPCPESTSEGLAKCFSVPEF